jgi:hypothetical protein
MKRLNWGMLNNFACLILLAVIAIWPTAGWSQAAKLSCDPNDLKPYVENLLRMWDLKLRLSWHSSPINPQPIAQTYDPTKGVLLPTCSKGPYVGPKIRDYFVDFLKLHPEATFYFVAGKFEVGGDCTRPFASGLYDFNLTTATGTVKAEARYTYVFASTGLIEQHHSSLVPMKPPQEQQECPEPPSKH